MGLAAAAGVSVPRRLAARRSHLTPYPPALLTGPEGAPFTSARITPHENYIFLYPYVSTPCFLLALDGPIKPGEVPVPAEQGSYRWAGGVGPGQAVVAYTAICPHQWIHPEREFSMIRYYPPGQGSILVGGRDRLITCCAHGSAFDPARGGRIEQVPADLPLAAIDLEWDPSTDRLTATGVRGIDIFTPFFTAFANNQRRPIEAKTPVMPLATYSKAVIRC